MKPTVILFVGAVLTAATVLAACDKDDDAGACAPLQSLMADARTTADEALATFRTGLQAAAATPPTAGTETCPVDVNRGLATHRAVRPSELDTFEPSAVRGVRGSAEMAEITVTDCEYIDPTNIQRSTDEIQQSLERVTSGHDLIVLEQSRVEPQVIAGTGTFVPGRLEARLLVWSYAESRFVCVADAVATSGDEVGTSSARRDIDSLNADLDRRVAVGGAPNLRIVAP